MAGIVQDGTNCGKRREKMRLNPNTRLAALLVAIPSAAVVLENLHIPISDNEDRSLQELCTEHAITVEEFIERLNNLNWDEDYHPQ